MEQVNSHGSQPARASDPVYRDTPAGWLRTAPVRGVAVVTFGNPYTANCGIYHHSTGALLAIAADLPQALRVRNMAVGMSRSSADRMAGVEISIVLQSHKV